MTAVAPERFKTFPVVLNPDVPSSAEPPSPTTSTKSIDSPSPTSTNFPPTVAPVNTGNPAPPFQGQLPGPVTSLPPAAGIPGPTAAVPSLPLETGQGLIATVSRSAPQIPAATQSTGEQRLGAPAAVEQPSAANEGVHAGIAVGSIAGTALLFGILFWAWRWRRRNIEKYNDPTMDTEGKNGFPPITFANRLRERLRWTTTTTSTDPLWGGTVRTGTTGDTGPVKTNSKIMDDMFAAAYAAEAGLQNRGYGGGGYYPDEKRMTQQSTQEFYLAADNPRTSSTRSQVFRWLRSRSAAVSEAMIMPPGTPRTQRPGGDTGVPPMPQQVPSSQQQSRWSFSTKKTASYYNNSRWDGGDQPSLVSMYAGSEAAWPPGKQDGTDKDKADDAGKRKSVVSNRTSMPGEVPWPDTPDPAWEMMPPPTAVTRK